MSSIMEKLSPNQPSRMEGWFGERGNLPGGCPDPKFVVIEGAELGPFAPGFSGELLGKSDSTSFESGAGFFYIVGLALPLYSLLLDLPSAKKSNTIVLNSSGWASMGRCPLSGKMMKVARGRAACNACPRETGRRTSCFPQMINAGILTAAISARKS